MRELDYINIHACDDTWWVDIPQPSVRDIRSIRGHERQGVLIYQITAELADWALPHIRSDADQRGFDVFRESMALGTLSSPEYGDFENVVELRYAHIIQ
jgi:hypothetical protein